MASLPNINGLKSAREKNSKYIELQVRSAIDLIVANGGVPSFYNVANQAQVARSTLYRRQELKELVQSARENARHSSMLKTESSIDSLLKRQANKKSEINRITQLERENERLKSENKTLRLKLKLTHAQNAIARSKSQASIFDYAIIKLDQAA